MQPSKLSTFSRTEVESHNSERSCFVLMGKKVYDVTDFINDHPGGAGLILDYAGKDITAILKDEMSHTHSDTAYEILDDSLVGFITAGKQGNGHADSNVNGKSNNDANIQAVDISPVPYEDPNGLIQNDNGNWVHPRTGMSSAEDLEKETNFTEDYKKHKFLDLNKPLLMQVFLGGFSKEFYLDQVHRPRHYKGGKSAPLFGNFLEPLSLTPWWVVPTVWLPPVCYGVYIAAQEFSNPFAPATLFAFGFFLWSLIEYILHRFLFHLDHYLPDNRYGITLHFLLHGVHHYLPMDKYRLVMPPTLFIVLASPFWKLAHTLFFWNWNVATTIYCGGIFGYICYDLTHYFLHHENLPLWYKELKKYHLAHHFLDYELGFGVTSKFWDRVFGTELVSTSKTK